MRKSILRPVTRKTPWIALLCCLAAPAFGNEVPDDGRARGECDFAAEIRCANESSPTVPSCDGFAGDPMFLRTRSKNRWAEYCRRKAPPEDYADWLAKHPESCRPGETRHDCEVELSYRGAEGGCPELETPDYYRVYPLNAHGGHRGLEPRRGEDFFYGLKSRRSYCRRLEAIEAENAKAKAETDAAFRRELNRKLLLGGGVLAALAAAWAFARRRAA
jgi:hypothetical protein